MKEKWRKGSGLTILVIKFTLKFEAQIIRKGKMSLIFGNYGGRKQCLWKHMEN